MEDFQSAQLPEKPAKDQVSGQRPVPTEGRVLSGPSWRTVTEAKSRSSRDSLDLTLYRPSTLLWLSGIAFLTVPLLTLVDVSLARWFTRHTFSSEVRSALDLTLVFSHGMGVFLVLVGIMLMAPRRRWQVPRIATLALGGGSVAMMAKLFVLRPKPSTLNLNLATTDSAWLWAFDWDLDQVATFAASTRAFPSANFATATALIVGLWVMLPRGRWLFLAIGIGQLMQQLSGGAHFLTDLIGGMAFGLLWGYVCFSPRFLGNLFDKMAPESPREYRRRRRAMQARQAMTQHSIDVASVGTADGSEADENESPQRAA